MNLFYLAGGIGAILTLFGLWRLVANFRFLARTTAVEGRFVSWDVTAAGKVGGPSSSDGRRSYRPIVMFRTVDGSEHRVMGSAYRQAFHKPDVPRGTAYPVRYDESNPSDAQLVTFVDFWLFPLAAIGVGIVCLAIAANSLITA